MQVNGSKQQQQPPDGFYYKNGKLTKMPQGMTLGKNGQPVPILTQGKDNVTQFNGDNMADNYYNSKVERQEAASRQKLAKEGFGSGFGAAG